MKSYPVRRRSARRQNICAVVNIHTLAMVFCLAFSGVYHDRTHDTGRGAWYKWYCEATELSYELIHRRPASRYPRLPSLVLQVPRVVALTFQKDYHSFLTTHRRNLLVVLRLGYEYNYAECRPAGGHLERRATDLQPTAHGIRCALR